MHTIPDPQIFPLSRIVVQRNRCYGSPFEGLDPLVLRMSQAHQLPSMTKGLHGHLAVAASFLLLTTNLGGLATAND
jgi:hypothetical protein